MPQIDGSDIMQKLGLSKNKFFLVTSHRAENVDHIERLSKLVDAFNQVHDKYTLPVIWSVHPHTRRELDKNPRLKVRKGIKITEPLGFFDFNNLQKNAFCVLSDSGTAPEECSIFGVPVVVLRDAMERPETLDAGSNFVAGCEPDAILRGIKVATKSENNWVAPAEYLKENVSDTVVRIVLSFWLRH